MSYELINPRQQFLDDAGNPVANGTLTFKVNLTTTDTTVYSDEALTTQQSNPYTLDANGCTLGDIRYRGKIRVILKDSSGSTIRTTDNVVSISAHGLSPITVDDYTELLALSPGNYSAGDSAMVSGVGVGGPFTVISGTTTDDGGTKKTNATWTAASKYWQRTDLVLLKNSYFEITGTGDETTKGQKWLNAVYALGCTGLIDKAFSATSLSLTMTGTRINQSLKIMGASRYGSSITKFDSSSSDLLVFQSSAPTTTHTDAQLYLSDFTLIGSAKASNGLALKGIAQFEVERVLTRGFDIGLNLLSSLVGAIKSCEITDNNTGIKTRRSGTAAYCNAIYIEDTKVKYNSSIGCDIGQGSNIYIENNCDIEQNGTAGDTTTGGIFVRATIDDETGYGSVTISELHLEANKGWSIYIEGASGGCVALRDVDIVNAESNRSLYAASGLRRLEFDNVRAQSSGNTIEVNAENFTAVNCNIDTLTNNATNYSLLGVKTSALDFLCKVKTATAGSDINIGSSILTAKNSPKGMCGFDGTASTPITPSFTYNVTNITKSATGSYVVNLTSAVTIGMVQITALRTGNSACDVRYVTSSTTTYSFTTHDVAGTLVDPISVNVTIYGA